MGYNEGLRDWVWGSGFSVAGSVSRVEGVYGLGCRV
jgi:hypothetical protein